MPRAQRPILQFAFVRESKRFDYFAQGKAMAKSCSQIRIPRGKNKFQDKLRERLKAVCYFDVLSAAKPSNQAINDLRPDSIKIWVVDLMVEKFKQEPDRIINLR